MTINTTANTQSRKNARAITVCDITMFKSAQYPESRQRFFPNRKGISTSRHHFGCTVLFPGRGKEGGKLFSWSPSTSKLEVLELRRKIKEMFNDQLRAIFFRIFQLVIALRAMRVLPLNGVDYNL